MPDIPTYGRTYAASPPPPRVVTATRVRPEATTWWLVFGLLFLLQAAWAVSTPLMTGPDESDHAIRAAAVVRGQLAGEPAPDLLGSDNVFVVVRVPQTYGRAATAGQCFVGTSATGSVGTRGAGGDPPCTEIGEGDAEVTARTLQYRGQPVYYALVGWPSLLTSGETGMMAMRLLTAALVAALCASAFLSACALPARRLGAWAVALTWSPVLVYLGATVNSTPLETSAAIGMWAAGAALARSPEVTRRLVVRFGVAGVLLVAARGLGPVFAGLILLMLITLAGAARVRELLARTDVRVAAVTVAFATVLAGVWLVWIQQRFPLDERTGTGVAHAAGRLPWFWHQTVGVFGVNDVSLPGWATVAWALPVLAVVIGGVRLGIGARRVLPLVALGLAAALSVSAEGASIPPIGYDWQGRYILPLLVGVPILAAAVADWDVLPEGSTVALLAAAPLALHVWAYVAVARHMASQGPRLLSLDDALDHPRWHPPGPGWGAWTLVITAVVAVLAAVVAGVPERVRVDEPTA